MPDSKRLRTQPWKRRRCISCVLLGSQHLLTRSATELITRRRLLSALLAKRNQLLRCRDLLLQRRRIDGRYHDIGRQRPARRLELEGLLPDLSGKRPVCQKSRTEEINGVRSLNLRGKDVIQKGRRLVRNRNGQCPLTLRGEPDIDTGQHRVADLGTQLLTCRFQRALRGGQRGTIPEPFVDQPVELLGLIRLPPLGQGFGS